jgi:serine/threonine protein kinase
MELCKETLADYLSTRQNRLFTLVEDNLFMKDDIKKYLSIFKQIVKSVEYIHQEQGLIHRDLKPANIFISKEDVKIGDFGLATEINDITYESKAKKINNNILNFHTKNVGTLLYAPHEQLHDNYYNEKVYLI